MRGHWCVGKSWWRKEDLEPSPGKLISRNRIGRAISASEQKRKWRCSHKTRREECQDAQIGRIWEKYHENFLLPKSNLRFYPYVLTMPSNLHSFFHISHFIEIIDKTNHVHDPCPHVDLRGWMAEWEKSCLCGKKNWVYILAALIFWVIVMFSVCGTSVFFAFLASFPSSFCDNMPTLL